MRTYSFIILLLVTLLVSCMKKKEASQVIPTPNPSLESLPYMTTLTCQGEDCGKSRLLIYKKKKAFDGYTLLSSFTDMKAFLIDMNGKIVHEWKFPSVMYSWSKEKQTCMSGELRAPLMGLCGGHVDMDEFGNLFVIVHRQMIAKLDWTAKLVWQINGQFNHDVDFQLNGALLTLMNSYDEMKRDDQTINFLNDSIVSITASGKIDRQISLAPFFSNIISKERLDQIHIHESQNNIGKIKEELRPDYFIHDLFHTNTVQVIDRNIQGVCQKGDVLLSLAHLNLIAIVNLKKNRIVWKWGPGEISKQHQPRLLENGHILVFDNGIEKKKSRVLEIDPKTNKIIWQYGGHDEKDQFFTLARGGVQRLPNGNTLICSSNEGRIFEVSLNGEIVWEYFTPFLTMRLDGEHPTQMRDTIYRAKRFPADKINKLLGI